MIESQFVLDILDLILDGEEEALLVKKQIPYLTDIDYFYTDVGCFISFSHSDDVSKFRTNKNSRFDGVIIEFDSVKADALVFLDDGIIDCLEIYNLEGDEYPQYEPIFYHLIQYWEGSPNRIISR